VMPSDSAPSTARRPDFGQEAMVILHFIGGNDHAWLQVCAQDDARGKIECTLRSILITWSVSSLE
jgi:hypothetical protein